MANRIDRTPRYRIGVIGAMALILMVALSACGPLGGDDEEPTATAGAQVPRATESASPQSSPMPNTSLDTSSASPTSESTPFPVGQEIDATPSVDNGASDRATPETDPASEASPGSTPPSTDDATPQVEETPADVVDSCTPDAIPPFEGDDPNFVVTVDLRFREGPGEDCDQIGEEPLGEGRAVVVLSEPVTREGEDRQWVQIEVDSETGWVAAEFIEPAE